LLKREDLFDDLGCGHKARKLGYVLADALRKSATVLLSVGSRPSSQCVAVAAAARRTGLRAHLVYCGDHQARPAHPHGSYALMSLLGPAVTWFERSPWEESAKRMASVAEAERERGEVPYAIAAGVSRWPGLAGSVELGLELGAQLEEPWRETSIVAAAGSGGTCVGLALAAHLSGLPWRVRGICIGGDADAVAAEARSLAAEAGEGIDLADVRLPSLRFHGGALGLGYDRSTDAELETMRGAIRDYGLVLDPNYMTKAFVGLRQLIAEGEIAAGSRVVLVHSGGSLGVHDPGPAAADWYRRALSVYLSDDAP